jgi:hypothetical protein
MPSSPRIKTCTSVLSWLSPGERRDVVGLRRGNPVVNWVRLRVFTMPHKPVSLPFTATSEAWGEPDHDDPVRAVALAVSFCDNGSEDDGGRPLLLGGRRGSALLPGSTCERSRRC